MNFFIYGTLMSTGRANRILTAHGCQRIGIAVLSGAAMYNVNGNFPAVVMWEGSHVWGELWTVPVDGTTKWRCLLNALDTYEGAPHLYTREECHVSVCGDDGSLEDTRRAYYYNFAQPTDNLEQIQGGVWDEQNNPELTAARDNYYHNFAQRTDAIEQEVDLVQYVRFD